jgi:hypothetical protein
MPGTALLQPFTTCFKHYFKPVHFLISVRRRRFIQGSVVEKILKEGWVLIEVEDIFLKTMQICTKKNILFA